MAIDILANLNPDQKKAVEHSKGPSLILAGAGSGKTRVLTTKVVYLIQDRKILPENILMVTFTNKAAGEMKERVRKMLNDKSFQLPLAGTFHSICAKILRRHGNAIGLSPDFVIYDEQDAKDAIKESTTKLNLDIKRYSPGTIKALISQAKNELITPLEYASIAKGYFQENAAQIYLEYQQLLRENHALDFDDLIFVTVQLLQKNEQVRRYYQERFHYILVDEYQDTNRAQYILTQILATRYRNICVVGDASQSIYAWRGADFRNIINFQNDYPDVQVFHLEQNYRSTQKILDTAFSVISKNTSHPILKLWTENEQGNRVIAYQAKNEVDESEFIVSIIKETLQSNPSLTFNDYAVLYRTNAQSRVVEEAFLRSEIPYLLIGGVRFYERKEIKDLISYLRLLINVKDSISYKRAEKIGKKRLNDFFSYRESFESNNWLSSLSSLNLLDDIIKSTRYLDLFNSDIEEDSQRLENIKELKSVASEFPNLTEFLENISLVESEYMPDTRLDLREKQNAITLMTLHSAKGLEFKIVFMIGMEEGLFPHSRTLMEPSELEEERRLCYVGITRAKQQLFFTFAARRLYFGQRNSNMVSRFVLDIPEKLYTLTIASDNII